MSMYDYGFGYDPEVPAGYQDADLEMAEMMEQARERQESEREGGRSFGYGESYAERNA